MPPDSLTRKSQTENGTSQQRQTRSHRQRGFTLTELMVSVAILVVAMLAVSYIFSAVSKTTGLTTAAIELTDAVDVLRRTMQDDLNAMAPGLLIIFSPLPQQDLRDLPQEPPEPQTRNDVMSFIVSGSPGQYQSYWNPSVTSAEAVVFYGQGMEEDPDNPGDLRCPPYLFDHILCRRAVLLVPDILSGPPELNGQWGHGQGAFDPNYRPPDTFGEVAWEDSAAFAQLNDRLEYSLVDVVERRTASDLIVRLRRELKPPVAFFKPSFAPAGPPAPSALFDRGRACFNLMPHVGQIILEWTDGSVADPRTASYDPRLQWFGLGRDVDEKGGITSAMATPESADVISRTAWSNEAEKPVPPIELVQFRNMDPPPPGGRSSPGVYLAQWKEDTWQYRPKAIRVTVRLYDENKRVRDGAERLGQERSFILEVP